MFKQKLRDVEEERKRFHEEKRLMQEANTVAMQKLETGRADFAAHVAVSTRAAEAGAHQLKEEEARLKRIKDELIEQRAQFEKRKAAAQSDMGASEQMRLSLLTTKDSLNKERAHIEKLARDLHIASEKLALRGETLASQEDAIVERENALREGLAHMQMATQTLSRREIDVRDSARELEFQRSAIDQADRVLTQRRIEAAAAQKSLSSRQAAATLGSLTDGSNPVSCDYTYAPYTVGYAEKKSIAGGGGVRSVSAYAQSLSSPAAAAPKTTNTFYGAHTMPSRIIPGSARVNDRVADRQQRVLEDHALTAAKKVLETVRGQLSRSSQSRIELGKHIAEEKAFIEGMEKIPSNNTMFS